MSQPDKQDEQLKPKKKKRGFFSKYLGFFALVAGISSAEKPWEEDEDEDEGDDQGTGGEPPKADK
jgi:hypothetical protein